MNAFEESLKGRAPEFSALLRSAQIVAATDVTVLLLGESGTGKELLAAAIHAASPRCNAPFVAINCAALPPSATEPELFGHCKGAFNGALEEHSGRFCAAAGGTLFLDEIGELPLNIQAKLLRFIETSEIQPLGETTTVQTDVRIISATHRDLYQQVQDGTFRADLYYRLNVVPLELPPLRQRSEDIELLLHHITAELAALHQLEPPRFSREALVALRHYSWPGNVRELRNLCERMVVLRAGHAIELANLPREMQLCAPAPLRNHFALPDDGLSLEEVEQSLIRQALDKSRGNRSRAARLLGLSRDTLLYRLKKYAIE